jgi:hypothetical protein
LRLKPLKDKISETVIRYGTKSQLLLRRVIDRDDEGEEAPRAAPRSRPRAHVAPEEVNPAKRVKSEGLVAAAKAAAAAAAAATATAAATAAAATAAAAAATTATTAATAAAAAAAITRVKREGLVAGSVRAAGNSISRAAPMDLTGGGGCDAGDIISLDD